ncbi:hypothetical protein GCM10009117_04630 [Gangjinia marincola]|uniref:Uncharacterized protein n=1 Tax=Gangjinia marincola TaxID=578463 RepID=A0ABN1MEN6_9FLAO
MKKMKHSKIDWKSKIIDFFIVIIGITIAFQLNTCREGDRTKAQVRHYTESFFNENQENISTISTSLATLEYRKSQMDTLQKLFRTRQYANPKIGKISATLTNNIDYRPLTITMDYITESGDLDLIEDFELRKQLVKTYESLERLDRTEELFNDFIKEYVTPYFFNKVRYTTLYPVDEIDFITDHRLENIITAYYGYLESQIKQNVYTLKELKTLDRLLEQ